MVRVKPYRKTSTTTQTKKFTLFLLTKRNKLDTLNTDKREGKTKMSKLDVKEGQTYICKCSGIDGWTLGKDYKVVFDDINGLVIVDDDGYNWCMPDDYLLNKVFKLKEKIFDLNRLATAELREYIDLLEDKEKSESLLNEFIERMTK